MMGTGVRMEMVNIQGMAPSGGANNFCYISPPPAIGS